MTGFDLSLVVNRTSPSKVNETETTAWKYQNLQIPFLVCLMSKGENIEINKVVFVAANTSEAIYDNDLEFASDDTLSIKRENILRTGASLESFIQRDHRIQVLIVTWNMKYKKRLS